ncbi:hypothetical protein B0E53_03780 [Micromonospora sp. MH33]|uniref:hypothetical protein n=1 Tax=Micromonospora sp. MH33 TaxID=1945509 RepID=UPI000D29C90A|nr:hypothetical protein [Micromonospora sp. MH33]PSK64263.1 hypothetical protein B0E53_03780 [Micromonospora sp. MH33]
MDRLHGLVKPLSLAANGHASLLARSTGSTVYYRLSLRPGNSVQLQAVIGSTVRGLVDGSVIGSATSTAIGAGRIGLETVYSSASCGDVTVTTGAGPSPTASSTGSPSGSPSPSPTGSPVGPSVGWRAVRVAGRQRQRGRDAVEPDDAHLGDRPRHHRRDDLPAGWDLQPLADGHHRGRRNGTSSARKKLPAYPGETPVLNFAAMSEDPANRGLALNGSFWHVYGIVVEHAGDDEIFVGGSNNIIERTMTRFNRGTGLQLSRIASDTPATSGRPTTWC